MPKQVQVYSLVGNGENFMKIDLDYLESCWGPYKTSPFYFADEELKCVNTILRSFPDIIRELRAARLVVEAFRNSDPYYRESYEQDTLDNYDEVVK